MSKHESKPGELMTSSEGASPKINFVKEILAGLTVSFVAISLGAAFGVMSGRGALSGILSAGVIALITAILGGTRIQCSGPTAPMTAVTVVMIGLIGNGYLNDVPNANSDHFLNIVLILTGAMLVLAAVLRLGKFINLVPKVVISGFMNGIAVLIWVGEFKTLFGLNSEKDSSGVELVDAAGNPLPDILGGGIGINLAVAIGTVAMCFLLPSLLKRIDKRLASFLPGTLVAIVLVSAGVFLTGLDMEKVALGGSLSSVTDLTTLVQEQIPTGWSVQLILLALPFAAQLAMLAYLDTLLTSLVVDQKVQKMYGTDEKTAQNKELAAQGVANSAVALFGGIPGAQATIRSVLILNEGAMTRIAGVMVGLFVLVEMILF
jgi:SulP family sulfate permease